MLELDLMHSSNGRIPAEFSLFLFEIKPQD